MTNYGRVFTPATVALIRKLAGQGKSASEIADAIGSTAASVRVKCCHFKIKLKRGRPALLRTPQPTHRDQKLVVRMSPIYYAALKQKAAGMQKSPSELAEMLLEAIIRGDIYEAVLDDSV